MVFFSGLPWHSTDTWDYLRQADAILAGNPISYFPNGYPLLIALVKVFTTDPTLTLAWLNVVFSTATVGLVMALSQKLNKTWVLAGILAAVWPNQLNYSRQLLSECATAFLLVSAVWLIVSRRYFPAGLLLYTAILFRSSLWPIAPVYLFVLWWFRRHLSIVKFACGFLIGLLCNGMLILLNVIEPSSNLRQNFLQAISSYSSNFQLTPIQFTPEQWAHPFRTYLRFAASHPLTFILQRLDSLWELWGFWPSYARSTFAKVLIGIRLPLLILGVVGFYNARRLFRAWAIFLPVVMLTLIHVAFYSFPRYTFVVEPLLIVLVAEAVTIQLTPSKTLETPVL